MKKKLWLLSMVGVVIFSACGGSSDEAKELQQKILKLVGIPQSIVVNICQDDNSNGFCDSIELQAKVTFSQGDTRETLLSKLTLTEEGQYLLETYDATKPLLLELKNTNSQYFTSNYILPFDGLLENEDEKELSILQAMIDKDALTTQQVSNARVMKNVDDFYAILLRDLEHNIQILTGKGLTTTQAVAENIIEMADELLINGIEDTIPAQMNACNNDQACVDGILNPLSIELVLTDAEANAIVAKVEESEPIVTDPNQGKIDFANYLPAVSTVKNYIEKYKFGLNSEEVISSNTESITRTNNILEYKYNEGDSNIITINENNISVKNSQEIQHSDLTRYFNIGDTIWTDTYNEESGSSETEVSCMVQATLTEFYHGGYTYTGDIIKERCVETYTTTINNESITGTDIWYEYMQKDIGEIASIDEDCEDETGRVNDSEGCIATSYDHKYLVQ
ncbi:MAG: Unknown protein [uncultured Sulfurovum sp.]|uniref:Chitinase n=1 Tax=uncultured Sulfurovum sp. TaxID=269237 RepID=A0A6S6UCW5_9BACT|nr:MAG: Unknown protein [uncultured Sulfurovum sp.]